MRRYETECDIMKHQKLRLTRKSFYNPTARLCSFSFTPFEDTLQYPTSCKAYNASFYTFSVISITIEYLDQPNPAGNFQGFKNNRGFPERTGFSLFINIKYLYI